MSDPSSTPAPEPVEPDDVLADEEFEDLATTQTTDVDNETVESANESEETE